MSVYRVGASLAEVEFTRFLPRRWLDRLMDAADVVIVVSGTPAVALTARRTATPVVLYTATLVRWEREAQVRAARHAEKPYRRLMRAIVSRCDRRAIRVPSKVLVLNERMLEWARHRARGDVAIAIPGTDTTRFTPGKMAATEPYFLFVGRMADPRKNIGGLLRAYAMYRNASLAPRRLVLAGLTRPRDVDAELIAALALSDHVEVRSPLSTVELVQTIQGATLFVSASHEEGLGLAFIEALACGVPVITTETDGARMVIRDGIDGALVRQGADTEQLLAEALVAWENASDAARQSCRERAETMFSTSVVSDSLLHLIESAASASPGSATGRAAFPNSTERAS